VTASCRAMMPLADGAAPDSTSACSKTSSRTAASCRRVSCGFDRAARRGVQPEKM
jgi:hypothetical protein